MFLPTIFSPVFGLYKKARLGLCPGFEMKLKADLIHAGHLAVTPDSRRQCTSESMSIAHPH